MLPRLTSHKWQDRISKSLHDESKVNTSVMYNTVVKKWFRGRMFLSTNRSESVADHVRTIEESFLELHSFGIRRCDNGYSIPDVSEESNAFSFNCLEYLRDEILFGALEPWRWRHLLVTSSLCPHWRTTHLRIEWERRTLSLSIKGPGHDDSHSPVLVPKDKTSNIGNELLT